MVKISLSIPRSRSAPKYMFFSATETSHLLNNITRIHRQIPELSTEFVKLAYQPRVEISLKNAVSAC